MPYEKQIFIDKSADEEGTLLKAEHLDHIEYGIIANEEAIENHKKDSNIHVTSEEKKAWNEKSNFSGSYNDLTDKPTKVSAFENDKGYKTEAEVKSIIEAEGFMKEVPSDYAKKSEIPTKTSQLTNDSGFLTSHQDISGKQDKSDTNLKTTSKEIVGAINELSESKADHSGWTPNMVIGTDANGNLIARATYTEAEKQALMNEIIDNLKVEYPQAHVIYGDVDSQNNIIIFGELADGTYTLKYENEDGITTEIGTLVLGGITNYADPTSADWQTNKRLNSSGVLVDTGAHPDGGAVTNFVPCKVGDVIRVKGMNPSMYYSTAVGDVGRGFAYFYAEDKTTIIAKNIPADGNGWVYENGIWSYTVGTSLTAVSGTDSDIRYVRLTGYFYSGYTANDVIITVNEEIA